LQLGLFRWYIISKYRYCLEEWSDQVFWILGTCIALVNLLGYRETWNNLSKKRKEKEIKDNWIADLVLIFIDCDANLNLRHLVECGSLMIPPYDWLSIPNINSSPFYRIVIVGSRCCNITWLRNKNAIIHFILSCALLT
jgi:hypothetical protein